MHFPQPSRPRFRPALAWGALLTALFLGALPASEGAGTRDRWQALDVPAWDISNEGLPFRWTWAWESPVDPLGRLLFAAETRWTVSVGYAKVYNSFDGRTGIFTDAGGHAALASAGREFRWRLAGAGGSIGPRWLPTVLCEFGAHVASRPFPAGGTRFNFKLLSGLEWRVGSTGWGAALIWAHFSNANVIPRNSGYDGLVLRISRPCGPRRAR